MELLGDCAKLTILLLPYLAVSKEGKVAYVASNRGTIKVCDLMANPVSPAGKETVFITCAPCYHNLLLRGKMTASAGKTQSNGQSSDHSPPWLFCPPCFSCLPRRFYYRISGLCWEAVPA